MAREFKVGIILLALVAALVAIGRPQQVQAQGGMSKATMKLLVADLLEADLQPTIEEKQDGTYSVTLMVDLNKSRTAGQVQTFATARSVTARVLAVRFE